MFDKNKADGFVCFACVPRFNKLIAAVREVDQLVRKLLGQRESVPISDKIKINPTKNQ